ncbi:MAG: glycogen/starch synthase, partial [Bacteroidales bacterium]
MRVLMFGWEFPPHISGGLGTACYGLTKGLAYHGLDIIFVVPKAYGDEDQSAIKVIGASQVPVKRRQYLVTPGDLEVTQGQASDSPYSLTYIE